MQGTPFSFVAEIAIPDARQCLAWFAPFIAIAAAIFLVRRLDLIIDRLFPNLEWEKRLGWLNFAAQRRAERVLRWLGYFVYAVLGVALLGIVWAAQGLASMGQSDDPHLLAKLALCVPVLLACIGIWLVYLGCELIPKLRGQYEEEELQKYRAEQDELERDRDRNPTSRLKSPLYKTRLTSPVAPNRNRLR